MYGKFFASTFTGSMLGAGAGVFAVWGYVIANKSAAGSVEINPVLLTAILGMQTSAVESAIEYLCAPDPRSRNQQDDGRRLVREGIYLYRVVSHSLYQKVRNEDDRREYFKLKKRESRANKSVKTNVKDISSVKTNVFDRSKMSNMSTHIDVDVDVEELSVAKATSPRRDADGATVDPEEHIYAAYPRKEGHRGGIKAISKAVARLRKGEAGLTPMELRDAREYLWRRVRAYARSPAGQRGDLALIPHPATWFNQSRYLDDDAMWQSTGESNGTTKPSATKQRIDGGRAVLAKIALDRGLVDPARFDGRTDAPIPIA
jgi:hypothetical protein